MSVPYIGIYRRLGYNVLLPDVRLINPFFQAAMFYHTRKTLKDVDPAIRVEHMTSPVLFLHGTKDELIPMEVSENLVNRSTSANKKLVLFQGSAHAVALATNPRDYRRTVRTFLEKL